MEKRASARLAICATLLILSGVARGAMAGAPAQDAGRPSSAAPTGGAPYYVNIPAAAFTPFRDGYDYENHGRYLFHKGGPEGWYVAPVYLPDGARVTRMTFYWYDDSNLSGLARLQRTEYGKGNFLEMAYADSVLGGGYGSSSDQTIAYDTIDNRKYGYWVVWDLPPAGPAVRACSVVIEYNPPALLPATRRISVPAAAFMPNRLGNDFINHGRFLEHYAAPGGGTGYGHYLAPVYLPDGATVTGLTFHWYSATTLYQSEVWLTRARVGKDESWTIAKAQSEGDSGYGSSSPTSIVNAKVDNSQYLYGLKFIIPPKGALVKPCGVVIEYTPPMENPVYISIPAAAFRPFADDWDYDNQWYALIHWGGADRAYYEAAVPLPPAAHIGMVTFYGMDDKTVPYGQAHLCRYELADADNYLALSSITSTDSPSVRGWSDASIAFPLVDSVHYGYWLYWDLPRSLGSDDLMVGRAMVIRLGYQIYLPLIRRH